MSWPSADAAALGIHGTPFGPLVDALGAERRRELDDELARRFATAPGEPLRRSTTAVVARATA